MVSMASRPKSVVAAADQRVGLVDQQHALVGLVEHLGDLGGGLADVAGDEPGAVALDEVAPVDDAEGPVDLGEQPGDRGLAGAGVAGEDEVAARVHDRQAPLLAQALHLEQVGDQPDLLLDLGQADQRVELVEQLVERAGRLLDRRAGSAPGRRRLRHGLRESARPGARRAACPRKRSMPSSSVWLVWLSIDATTWPIATARS